MTKDNKIANFIISAIYIISFVLIFVLSKNQISSDDFSSLQVWLTSGIVYLILGKYLLERYFATPTNVFANSLGIVIAMAFDPNKSIAWLLLIIFFGLLSIIAIIVICTCKVEYKLKEPLFQFVTHIGKSSFQFSLVFLVYSYFYLALTNNFVLFIISIILWLDIINFHFIEKFIYLLLKKNTSNNKIRFSGELIEKYNDKLYIIAKKENCNKFVCFSKNEKEFLLGKVIASEKLLDQDKSIVITNNISYMKADYGYKNSGGLLYDKQLIWNPDKQFYEKNKTDVETLDNLYSNTIGYIVENTNVNIITFLLFNSHYNKVTEGTIIYSFINGQKTMFQIINAKTKRDEFGNILVTASKIGIYDSQNNRLASIKWLPNLYSFVYYDEKSTCEEKEFKEGSIGLLPGTNYPIMLSNINHLVTYNTAILGILGIGKSCLAFELIKNVIDSNIKVICIDITNQYSSYEGLYKYISYNLFSINDEISITEINSSSTKTGANNRVNEWGNINIYKSFINKDIEEFLKSEDKLIKVINPNKYNITKAASSFNIVENTEVSLVEKTRYICEAIFENIKALGFSDNAKCLIVFEEAHSLIPEFSSISIKGDDTHANAISKVILQGRKYGLGSLLVTQRTANISKSALNQCNTIFALRCYDDTSKAFLNNYIGSDYSNLLPTLEERSAIVTGKGIDCKLPLIINLNDKKEIECFDKNTNPTTEDDDNVVNNESNKN